MIKLKNYRFATRDLLRHIRNYYYCLMESGLILTLQELIAEMYFWSCLGIYDFSEDKAININGFVFYTIPGDIGISAELKVFGNHEPLSAVLLPKILKPNMVCVDIGANLGFYALIERRAIGRNGELIVVEPNPLAAKFLEKNLISNGFAYIFKNIAVSDRNGLSRFVIDNRSNLCQLALKGSPNNSSIISVQTMTLDSLLSSLHFKVDFLRMDVEGAEALIAKGWNGTIENDKPLLFLEIHKKIGVREIVDILSFLSSKGYKDAFYIHRPLNNCLMGKQSDIRKVALNKLIYGLKSGRLPLQDFHIITGPKLDTNSF